MRSAVLKCRWQFGEGSTTELIERFEDRLNCMSNDG